MIGVDERDEIQAKCIDFVYSLLHLCGCHYIIIR